MDGCLFSVVDSFLSNYRDYWFVKISPVVNQPIIIYSVFDFVTELFKLVTSVILRFTGSVSFPYLFRPIPSYRVRCN